MATVTLEQRADPADIKAVADGLHAFNRAYLGDSALLPVHLFLRDEQGVTSGGLLGEIRWGWLFVSKLWIAETLRGQGYGTELLHAAEAVAREHGCIGVYLDTFEHQARPFYEKLGYQLFGTLEGYPAGHRQYHLAKRLSET